MVVYIVMQYDGDGWEGDSTVVAVFSSRKSAVSYITKKESENKNSVLAMFRSWSMVHRTVRGVK